MTDSPLQLVQCPFCQHPIGVTKEQLANVNHGIRCEQCHQTFDPAQSLANTTQPMPSQATQELLFDDDTGIDELEIRFDDRLGISDDLNLSIEEPAAPTASKPATSAHLSKAVKPAAFDIVEDFDNPALINTPEIFKSKKAVANTADDESWLNELLEADRAKEHAQRTTDDHSRSHQAATAPMNNDVSEALNAAGLTGVIDTDPHLDLALPYDVSHDPLATQTPVATATPQHTPKLSLATIVWGVGSVILLLTLFVQYMVFNFDDMLRQPGKSELFSKTCTSVGLHCALPIININAIDTRTLSVKATASNTKQSDLIFTLKNSSTQAVLYPNLKITLRDGMTAKADWVMTPSEYLDHPGRQLNPEQLVPVKLRVDYPSVQFKQVNIEPFY